MQGTHVMTVKHVMPGNMMIETPFHVKGKVKDLTMATRWGCIGPGKIASDFFQAMVSNLSPADHQPIAVASTNQERGVMFAEKYGFKKVYLTYEELEKDEEIDVVYIATLNTSHVELSKKMLHAGKHVLCEKPMAMTYKQAKEVLDLAKEKKLLFIEAVWSRFLPAFHEVRQAVKSGSLGEIKLLDAKICVPLADVQRIRSLEMGGGGCIDIGIYGIQSACMVFNEMPESITAVGTLLDSGADESACIILKYRSGALAVVSYSVSVTSHNTMVISGTNGWMEVEDPFWCSEEVRTSSWRKHFPMKDGNFFFNNSGGLVHEAQAVRECLLKGKTEHEYMNHEQSEMIHKILTEVRHQLGVAFPGFD